MKIKAILLSVLFLLLTVSGARATIVFYSSDGDAALAALNEDYANPVSKITFVPGERGKYGVVYFGFEGAWQQGGVNDQGLFFNWIATQPVQLEIDPEKEIYAGNIVEKIMEECATVEEALVILRQYFHRIFEKAQLFLGDAQGHAVIVEGDVVLEKEEVFQLSTSVRKSRQIPGVRYTIAQQLLVEASPTIDGFRTILSATRQEVPVPTQYSAVCDLQNGRIFLYHFHNFENQLLIEVRQQLDKGRQSYELEKIFPKTYAYTVYKDMWLQAKDRNRE